VVIENKSQAIDVLDRAICLREYLKEVLGILDNTLTMIDTAVQFKAVVENRECVTENLAGSICNVVDMIEADLNRIFSETDDQLRKLRDAIG
jgi:hypothetical protein